ncbi:MAG TPA: DUF411 domain-containing protein [Lysobacter sp.]
MKRPAIVCLLAATVAMTACSQPAGAQRDAVVAATPAFAGATVAVARAPAALPRMVVTKSPSCGCCGAWVAHARDAGFEVEVRDVENPYPLKERLGVPYGKGSCHTAEVGGYFIEGHVPLGDVKRLLAERPDARGLVVPGMPAGSPGMETPDGHVQPYTVELVARDGSTTAFARHGGS